MPRGSPVGRRPHPRPCKCKRCYHYDYALERSRSKRDLRTGTRGAAAHDAEMAEILEVLHG
jgi:hypothetical protein